MTRRRGYTPRVKIHRRNHCYSPKTRHHTRPVSMWYPRTTCGKCGQASTHSFPLSTPYSPQDEREFLFRNIRGRDVRKIPGKVSWTGNWLIGVCLLTLKHLVSLQVRTGPSFQDELDLYTSADKLEKRKRKRIVVFVPLNVFLERDSLQSIFFFSRLYRDGVCIYSW